MAAPEVDLTELAYRRRTGEWPSGTPPRWARALATALRTRVGSAKFEQELDRRYVTALEERLRPFAELGAALDPRKDGRMLEVEGSDGQPIVVTSSHLRAAAKLLGHALRRREEKVEILASRQLVDGQWLAQVRWQAAHRSSPTWLLLREESVGDGERRLEALAYSGKVRQSLSFAADDAPPSASSSLSCSRSAKEITDPTRRKAVGQLTRAGVESARALHEAYDRLIRADDRERLLRRRWKVVSDLYVTRDGTTQDRLIRLSLGDHRWGSGSDAVLLVTADGEVKRVDEALRRGPPRPRWQFLPFPREAADKLLAGLAAGGQRLIAEGLEPLDELSLLTEPVADAAWRDLSAC